MSKKHRKMLNAAINTDALMFEDTQKNLAVFDYSHTNTAVCKVHLNLLQVKSSRLKERDVKHVKISDTSELSEIYNFGEQIGQGSFGTVISIVDKTTEKDWAMKIVNKSEVGEKLITLQREIQILKMVDHPHIIYLDKVYECAKKIYLVLERCYGVLSIVYKEKKQFSELETRKIIGDLISAVAYLHKNDIVHRDLKLENILIAKNPNDINDELYIKITDFGLGIIKHGSGYEDMLHEYCGTIMYMAPEIITSRSYSQQCDVWAVGVIMYSLLSGHFPFYSAPADEQEMMSMICNGEPSYSTLRASTEAIHLITKMLAKNPALRITAAEVVIHPWIVGKPMTHELDSPENVLDMMRLWRSEMMLPVGDECDWVSSAKGVGSSIEGFVKRKSSELVHMKTTIEKKEATKEPKHASYSQDSAATTGTRRQSMRLPVKNIRFDRTTNESRNTTGGAEASGRRASNDVSTDDLHASRRGSLTPPLSASTPNGRSGHAESPTATRPFLSNKAKMPEKSRKKTSIQ